MSQSLIINGKEYVQSSVLTATYKYTPDYIGKLAREEKIIGTQVGRQWYIEPESLKIFLQKASVEKEIRAETLRLKRKIEHQAFQNKNTEVTATMTSPYVALAQMVAIVGCGLLVGVLGLSGQKAGVTMVSVTESVKEGVSLFATSFSPVRTIAEFNIQSKSFLAASSETAAPSQVPIQNETKGVYATLPLVSLGSSTQDVVKNLDSKGDVSTITERHIQNQFSDEVDITIDEDGTQFVRPIFKKGEGSDRVFKVVPVE